jgi:HemY protein
MFKAFLYLLLVAGAALGLAWFAENPGSLTLNWLNREIETSVFVAAIVIFSVASLLLMAIALVVWLITSPRRMSRYLRERRRVRGYEALRRGMFAVGAGDETAASRYAMEARRNLPNEPMTKLLRAQSAQLSGDRGTARRIFETLADEGDTQLLGLRGLFLEANYEGHTIAARQFADRAVSLNPALPWAVHALFDMQCKERDWQGALETLAVARARKHFGRKALDRKRAVLLTAQAMELQDSQPAKALELASEAHRLAPGLIPAANIAGRLLAAQGAAYKAARVIARTWQVTPHPQLATAYAFARPGDSPRDRLGRIKTLVAISPNHPESRVALAVAACDAHEWDEARAALQPRLASNPTARVCALMARIEGSQKRDAGRVREWLARAVRAPRDPVWMADGIVADEWAPISPVTGALDAFEWRTPSDSTKGAADALMEDVAALSLELEAVARSMPEVSVPQAEPRVPTAQPAAGERARVINHAPVAVTSPPPVEPKPAAVVTPPPAPVSVSPVQATPSPKPAPAPREPVAEIVPARRPAENAAAPIAREPARSLPVAAEASRPTPVTVAKPAPSTSAVPAVPPARRAEPKIFVPDRAPDDPGPEPAEPDEAQTPLGRFLSSMKQQAT